MKKKDDVIFTVSYLASTIVREVSGLFLTFMALSENVTVMVLQVGEEHFWINCDGIITVKVTNPPKASKYDLEKEPQSNYVQ